MRTSEHYELNLVEGTDKVNPLVQDVPNYETIDGAMYNNKCASIGIATELRTGTVHALVRQNEDAPMFRFTATSNYTSGDTFTVDGVQVSALLVDGTPLPNMAYIIGSEVLCVLKGTLMTVFANRTTSSDSDRLGGELPSHYATDSDLDALEGVVNAHTGQINQINSDLLDYTKNFETLYELGAFTNFDIALPQDITPGSKVRILIHESSADVWFTKELILGIDIFLNQPAKRIFNVGGYYINSNTCGSCFIQATANGRLQYNSIQLNGADKSATTTIACVLFRA